MTDGMTIVPFSGRLDGNARGPAERQPVHRPGGAAPKEADQGRAHCGYGAYRHRLR
jgi:hypothetical protein